METSNNHTSYAHRCVTLKPNEVHSAFITRKNIITCQEHLEHKLLLLNARFILKWQIALLGEEKRLKVAGRDSKMCRHAAGRTCVVWVFLLWSAHVLRTWKRYGRHKGKVEASSRLPRARLTIAPTWPNTALQAELTIYMHWTKREVLRNYIRLYKTNHTFSEHLRRLSRNLRHFSVQHKNTVAVSAGGITLYSLRSHQLT